jgi:hypothetical protein
MTSRLRFWFRIDATMATSASGAPSHAELRAGDRRGSTGDGMVCCTVALRQTISIFSSGWGLRAIAVGIIV